MEENLTVGHYWLPFYFWKVTPSLSALPHHVTHGSYRKAIPYHAWEKLTGKKCEERNFLSCHHPCSHPHTSGCTERLSAAHIQSRHLTGQQHQEPSGSGPFLLYPPLVPAGSEGASSSYRFNELWDRWRHGQRHKIIFRFSQSMRLPVLEMDVGSEVQTGLPTTANATPYKNSDQDHRLCPNKIKSIKKKKGNSDQVNLPLPISEKTWQLLGASKF